MNAFQTLLKHLESEFQDGDNYAFWTAIFTYTSIEKEIRTTGRYISLQMPAWILDELHRISGEIDDLVEGDGRLSPQLSKIFKLDGKERGKQKAESKRKDARVAIAARKLLEQGNSAQDDLTVLNNKFGNEDRVKKVYFKTKKSYRQKVANEIQQLQLEIQQLQQQIEQLEKK